MTDISITDRTAEADPDESTAESDRVVHINALTHWFPTSTEPHVALQDIRLDVPKSQFVCLVGPSGCGKTTLLNIVAGQIVPQRGEVVVTTRQPLTRAVGYMFARDSLIPWRSIEDNVAYGLELRRVPKRQRRERAAEMLDLVGLGGKGGLLPKQLSHGMRQRANLARTLAIDPELLLVDEPFGALDAQNKARLQDEFLRIWEGARKTVVFVTHDLSEAALLADRIVVMGAGRIQRDIAVDFPRPRNLDALRFKPEFQDLVRSLWDIIREGGAS